MLRRAAYALIAAVASLPAARSIADEPPPVKATPPSIVQSPPEAPPTPSPAPPAPPKEPPLGIVFNAHTLESLPLTETEPTVEAFSALVEDRGMEKRVQMDPRLIELLRTIARKRKGTRFEILSGYRSLKRNEMMRKKGRNVASHSQHTLGGAIDIRIDGMSTARVYGEIARLKWEGGLGIYPGGRDRFVHVDVGPKRRWWGH